MSSSRVVRVHAGDQVGAQTLRDGIAKIQSELEVSPAFAPEVEEAARRAAAAPRLPDLDRTDLPLVTIDPPSSMDLDQALHLEREGSGYVVHYAIADVAAFIEPGDPVDVAANQRGETLYGADSKVAAAPDRALRGRRLAAARPGPARRCSGRSTSTTPARAPRSRSSGPGSARPPSSTTRPSSRPSTTAPPTRPCSCSRRSAGSGWSARRPGAASRSRCPSRRSTSGGHTGRWSSAPRSRPRAGTPRSPC